MHDQTLVAVWDGSLSSVIRTNEEHLGNCKPQHFHCLKSSQNGVVWNLCPVNSVFRRIFVYTFSKPSDIQKWWFEIKMLFVTFFPTSALKKLPKQAKHEQINVFRPNSEQKVYSRINFYFVLHSNILIHSFEQIVRK
jgi:hypothetical protein